MIMPDHVLRTNDIKILTEFSTKITSKFLLNTKFMSVHPNIPEIQFRRSCFYVRLFSPKQTFYYT